MFDMKKETIARRMIRIGLFMIIAMSGCMLMAVAPAHQPGTGDLARNARLHPLLSELPQAGRFSMSYPMVSVPYGAEYSFQNKAWLDFIAKHGTGWRIISDSRTGRPNIIEGKGIPFYAGRGNSLTRDYRSLISCGILSCCTPRTASPRSPRLTWMTRAIHVCGLMMPSLVRPLLVWNAFAAAAVKGPNTPSTVSWWPRARSRNCNVSTGCP